MASRVFDLEGRVGLEDKNFLAKVKRIREANKAMKRELQIKAGTLKPTKEYQALERQIRQAEKAVQDLNKQQDKQAKSHTRSSEYKQMEKDIAATEARLDKLVDEQIALAETGITHGTLFESLDSQIETTRVKLEEMKQSLRSIAETGATDKEAKEWYVTADAIDTAEKELAQYKAQQARMVANGSAYEKTGGQKSFFGRLGAGFSNARKQLKKYIPLQGMVSKGFNKMGKQANKMKRGLFMGAGIKGLVRLGAAGAIALYSVRMLKQGLENLRQYDQTTNASIQAMSNSLATLKNALATAFAPILNVVAPILATFIDWLTAGVTAIAHFMAALTGQSQVTIARKTIGGVASSAGSAADNTNAANDAAKEYQKTLMGFDQINKLDEPTSGSGGSGGGGGGGAGGGGVGSMFETVPIDSTMQNWADKIKEAWEKADFYDIGRAAGEKLRDGLNSIPWDDIQEIGRKVGKSVATGLNGFFETPDLGETIGKTIAEALDTIVITVNSFEINFNWDSLGKFVGDSINGFFKNFDWKLTGETMSGLATGILDSTITAVRTVDWKGVGSSIMDMITSIDYAEIGKRLITLLGDAISGAADLISGAVETLKNKIVQKFNDGTIWKDIKEIAVEAGITIGKITSSIFKVGSKGLEATAEITAAVIFSGVGWLYEKLTGKDPNDPTVRVKLEKVQTVFGDFLEELVKFILSPMPVKISLIQGVISKGIEWIVNKLSGGSKEESMDVKLSAVKVGDVWDSITTKLSGTVSYAAEKIGKVWDALNNTVKGTAQYVADKIGKTWDSLSSTVKGTANYYADKAGKTWNSLNATLKGTVNYYAAKAGKGWKNLTKKLKSTVTFSAKWARGALSWLKGKAKGVFKAEGGVYSGGRWRPIQSYATGGEPNTGQMFIARENGPEFVGTIGGNTAVMNNDQIVASVSDGVARAMADVMRNFSSGDGTSVVIEGDMAQFFRVVQQKAIDYTRSTGQPAFPV